MKGSYDQDVYGAETSLKQIEGDKLKFIFKILRQQQYQRQINNMSMNLKYNRIDMKNENREGKCSMKLRKRQSQNQKVLPRKQKLTRSKKSPPTREFGTDLTNRPTLSIHPAPSPTSSPISPPELASYLPSITHHLILTDQTFTTELTARLAMSCHQDNIKISPEMRRVLLKWLFQVGRKFQVKEETLQICVQLIDLMLVLETARINKQNFQLLGVSALFVASKYNEIHTFQAEKYIYLCDGLYSLPQLFQMESIILISTQFNLQFPTLCQFTQLTLQQYDIAVGQLAVQLGHLAMLDFSLFNRFQKSHLAAVIIYFAAKLNESGFARPKEIIEEMQVPEDIFRDCYMILLGLYRAREDLL